jgi:hypothetical protein
VYVVNAVKEGMCIERDARGRKIELAEVESG